MGYQNANLVAVHWGHLPGTSFKVLVRMALSSSDRDEVPRYFAGPGPLLLALGRVEVEPGDVSDEARRVRECSEEMLRKAVQVLRQMGLVTYAVTPARGRTPEYWLHLEPGKGQRFVGKRANDSLGQNPERANDSLGRTAVYPNDSLAPEKRTSEDLQADEGQTNSAQVTSSPADEDPYAAAHRILSTLPDLGAALLARVGDGPLRTRVIAAAALHTNPEAQEAS